MNKSLRATAYHEAGHAVAHFALGRRIDRVTVRPTEDTLGHVRGRVLTKIDLDRGEDVMDVPSRNLEDYAVILLAGPIAERRFAGRWDRIGASGDYEAATNVLVSMEPDDTARDAHVRYLEAVATRLVGVHWYLVEAVASAVLERGTLSGVSTHRVIRTAILAAAPRLEESIASLGPLTPRGWRETARAIGYANQTVRAHTVPTPVPTSAD